MRRSETTLPELVLGEKGARARRYGIGERSFFETAARTYRLAAAACFSHVKLSD